MKKIKVSKSAKLAAGLVVAIFYPILWTFGKFKTWFYKTRLFLAIHEAESGYKMTKKRHYVFYVNGLFYVYNTGQMKHIKRVLGNKTSFDKIKEVAVYVTK